MNQENYVTLLKWKLAADTELAGLLSIMFDSRMSEGEYNKTKLDVNTVDNVLLVDRETLPHYRTVPSFFEKNVLHGCGLRRRVCGFFRGKEGGANGERDVEMGTRFPLPGPLPHVGEGD